MASSNSPASPEDCHDKKLNDSNIFTQMGRVLRCSLMTPPIPNEDPTIILTTIPPTPVFCEVVLMT